MSGTVCLCIILGEIILRILGFRSVDELVKPVEELAVYQSFVGKQDSLFVANKDFDAPPEDVRINSEGFRTPEFDHAKGDVVSVMLIGDSFTGGSNAKPLAKSFADLLRKEKLVVHNLGIRPRPPAARSRRAAAPAAGQHNTKS